MSDNVKCHVQHTFIRVSQSCPGKTVRQILKKKKKSCKIDRRTELKRQFGTGKQEPASRVDRNAGANTSVVAPKELYSWKYSELSENSLNYVLAV